MRQQHPNDATLRQIESVWQFDNMVGALTKAVPCAEKDEVKKLGERWDAAKKVWFVPDGKDAAPFYKWFRKEGHPEIDPTTIE